MAELAFGALLFVTGAYASATDGWLGLFSLLDLALIYMGLGTFGVAALYFLARVTIWRNQAPKGTPSRHES